MDEKTSPVTAEGIPSSATDASASDTQSAPAMQNPVDQGETAADSELSEALLEAVEEGDTEAVVRLLEAGADPNSRDSLRRTALILAVQDSQVEIIRLLLEHGADVSLVDDVGGDAHRYAVRMRQAEMLQQLEAAGATSYVPDRPVGRDISIQKRLWRFRYPLLLVLLILGGLSVPVLLQLRREHLTAALFDAIAHDDDAAAYAPLVNPALDPDMRDAHGITPLMMAAYHDRPLVVRSLLLRHANPNLQDSQDNTALHWAWINHVDMAIIQNLLESGADPNKADRLDRTILAYASEAGGYSELVKLLLKHGANPNVMGEHIQPLICAIVVGKRGDTDLTLDLLEHGADPNVHSWDGVSALGWAVDQHNLKIVLALLDRQATVDAPDNVGRTPLIVAVQDGNAPVVKVLLQHGANPNFKDRLQRTPLMVAAQHKPPLPEIAAILRAAGAQQ